MWRIEEHSKDIREFEKGGFSSAGALCAQRGGREIYFNCAKRINSFCSDKCPMLSEPIKTIEESGREQVTAIDMCEQFRLLFKVFHDKRGKQDNEQQTDQTTQRL